MLLLDKHWFNQLIKDFTPYLPIIGKMISRTIQFTSISPLPSWSDSSDSKIKDYGWHKIVDTRPMPSHERMVGYIFSSKIGHNEFFKMFKTCDAIEKHISYNVNPRWNHWTLHLTIWIETSAYAFVFCITLVFTILHEWWTGLGWSTVVQYKLYYTMY